MREYGNPVSAFVSRFYIGRSRLFLAEPNFRYSNHVPFRAIFRHHSLVAREIIKCVAVHRSLICDSSFQTARSRTHSLQASCFFRVLSFLRHFSRLRLPTHITTTYTMSAAFKSLAVVSGLALTGAATMHSANRKSTDFSASALHASGIDVLKEAKPKAKL